MNLITNPPEYEECLALVSYLQYLNIPFAHIHQEWWTTSWKQKNRAKALGVSPGVPDYMIVLPDKLLFIEMKRRKGGQVSEHQKKWIEILNNIDNKNKIEAVVCKGFDEAKKIIDNYKC